MIDDSVAGTIFHGIFGTLVLLFYLLPIAMVFAVKINVGCIVHNL